MKLIIKIVLISCLGWSTVFSQEAGNSAQEDTSTNPIEGIFELGFVQSTGVGDNFINDAYPFMFGGEIGFDFIFKENYIAGIGYEFFAGSVKKPERVGNFRRTTIHTITGNLGYFHRFSPKLNLSGLVGVGYGHYNNRLRRKVKFYDQSTVLSLQTKVGYNVADNFGFYGALKFRYDFMSIKTAPEIQDYFDDAQILTFSLGIRFF